MTRPIIFISYSHQDETEKKRLIDHLKVLETAGLAELWVDDRIEGGADWEKEIKQAIAQASVAVLLISSKFLTSEFIQGKEVPEFLNRRQGEGLIVFPIIARACYWEATDWLVKMNVRPKNGTPVWSGNLDQIDQRLAIITKEIGSIVTKIGKTAPVTSPSTTSSDTAPEKPKAKLLPLPRNLIWSMIGVIVAVMTVAVIALGWTAYPFYIGRETSGQVPSQGLVTEVEKLIEEGPVPPTKMPTQGSTPTSLSSTKESSDVIVRFSKDMNIRSGPSTDYNVIGFAATGDSAKVLGHNADQSWIQIEYVSSNGNVGWVFAILVDINGNLQAIPLATADPPTPKQFKSRSDFNSDYEYGKYIQSVIEPGMRVRALRNVSSVKKGMKGTYFGTLSYNFTGLFIWDDDLHMQTNLLPDFPADKRTHGDWMLWYDIEIIQDSSNR